MDFESAITVFLFLLFFILPSIIKQVRARKQKTTQTQKVKKPSFFTKIGEQIQRFVQELEQQTQQQQQTAKAEENIGEALSEDAAFYKTDEPDLDSVPPPATELFSQPARPPAPSDKEKRLEVFQEKNAFQSMDEPGGETVRFRKNTLQNAIVWAEILSKPVALRDGER
ncbi:MAG: hypothetical protein L3J69_17015 [Desulfobacula sp.]|nr:hypothetical protein [Desulfobacula sp.]